MIRKKATQVLILYDEDILYLIPVLTLIFMHIITTRSNSACAHTKDL